MSRSLAPKARRPDPRVRPTTACDDAVDADDGERQREAGEGRHESGAERGLETDRF
jgi:hypothetical protein